MVAIRLAHHLVFRFDDAAVLAPDVPTRRAIARIVLNAAAERGLLGFGLADNHLHVLLLGDEPASRVATECGRLVPLLRPGARFEPTRIRPVHHQAHLENTLLYVQRQDLHHGVDQDPRREGTSLPDLLGLRVVAPRLVVRVRVTLPRLRGRDLLANLGIDGLEERVVPEHLVEATCAALALPDLSGQTQAVRLARCAAVRVATSELYDREIAERLGVTVRTIERTRVVEVAPALLRAVRLQMDLQSRVPAFDAREPYVAGPVP